MRKTDAPSSQSFAARHFAARRAGFLLREHRRQQTTRVETPDVEDGVDADVDAGVDGPGEGSSAAKVDAPPMVGVISSDEADRRVAEAERRGREEGQAALVAALDQAIAALDAAGRAIAEAHGDLERRWVVPLAQASLHIGGELARQALMAPSGLQRYLEAVHAALRSDSAEVGGTDPYPPIVVRLNPEDIAVLERASLQPSAVRLVADPLVPRSGAIASSDDKVVDDRFENRLRFAKEAVLAAAADLLREAPS
jgi:flagellar biosynthesis/type III secretory pathway protein FliH